MSILAARLRTVREKAGLSQVELANKVGISAAAICQYEAEGKTPSLKRLKKLAEVLEVSADYLMGMEQGTPQELGAMFRNFQNMTTEDKDEMVRFYQFLKQKNKR